MVLDAVTGERYDIGSARHHLHRYEGPLGSYFRTQEEDLVLHKLPIAGKRVLDVGCGAGRLERVLSDLGAQIVLGCDVSEAMVRAALSRGTLGRTCYFVCDGMRLPLSNESVDTVFALGTLEAATDIVPFAKEIRRVLSASGAFIFTVWNRNRWYRWEFLDGRRTGSTDHDAETLRQVLEANGFGDIHIRTTFFLPRRLFWVGYKCARIAFLDRPFIVFCNSVARFLRARKQSQDKGWVLLVTAKARVR